MHDGGLSRLLLQYLGGLAVLSQTLRLTEQAELFFCLLLKVSFGSSACILVL